MKDSNRIPIAPEGGLPSIQQLRNFQPGEYVFRNDPPREFLHPPSIEIEGTLGAPKQFLDGKRYEDITTHLRIYKDLGKLILIIQDNDPYTTHVIEGSLKRDTVLEQFKINTEKRWNTQEFLKFIRMNRYFFADKGQHTKMVESLMKWTAKIETVLKEHQNNNGNSLFELEKKVSGVELVNKFDLEIALFQGYPKERFTVEIGLDPKSNQVDLFLLSDQLVELEIGKREAIIEAEISKFSDRTFSKVVVS